MGLDQGDAGPVLLGRGDWLVPAGIVLAGLVGESGGQAVRDVLQYDRTAIAAGEWWRLVSGHFVHLGWPHFLMNAAGLLLIWALLGRYLRVRHWLTVLCGALVVIDAGFWLLDTGLERYVGLSGLLHAVLVAGIVAGARAAPVEMSVLGTLMMLKILYEQTVGPVPGSAAAAGGAVIVNAHLYGAVAGAAIASLLRFRRGRPGSL